MNPKPCPFCGESKDFGIGRGTEDREGFPTYIFCATCGTCGPWIYTQDKALWTSAVICADKTGWNKRHTNEETNQ